MTEEKSITPEVCSKENKKREYHPHKHLLFIADQYLSDLECYREMFTSVIPLLQDQEIERKDFLDSFLQKTRNSSRNIAQKTDSNDEEYSIKVLSSDLNKVFSNILKLNRAERLFRRQSIVSLISSFDDFLGGLLKIILKRHPEWLKSSEKTITYRELVDLESIDKAINNLIDNEVDALLRESHEKQIDFIDEKLKLGVKKEFTRLPAFLEVTERRNLLVHTGGRISCQYLAKCASFNFKVDKDLSVGKTLIVDDEYFNEAFSLCFELGLRISQASYRRLFQDEIIMADKALNELAIKFLNSGDYGLAEIVCDFDLAIPEKLKSKDSEYIYFAKINRAIAQKFSGKSFENSLEGVHWQAFHPKYILAINVLREQFDEAGELMKSPVIQESIGKLGFRGWPLFKEFRDSEQFKKSYLEIYHEEYIPNPQQDMKDEIVIEKHLSQKEDNN